MRVYVPATIGMLRHLVDEGQLTPVRGTAFSLTPALREAYVSGSTEELEYAALLDAARASLRLLGADGEGAGADEKEPPRRVVVAAELDESAVSVRPDLDSAVVRVSGSLTMDDIAAVHVDSADAEQAVHAAAEAIDRADLGDLDAEFVLGEAEDHELAWYAPQELPFFLELM
ncbi:hypothetical protein [Saccharomonospora sp. CUA-673]|uniref:DUF6912 family protein n=1 Tax=Saccharomonospora sp. CUA-673 TaxID=1904969 RepID=UPI00165183E7|nr:hypothetical protein [Saccharomonospora sp. CUA-673]